MKGREDRYAGGVERYKKWTSGIERSDGTGLEPTHGDISTVDENEPMH